MYCRYCGKEVDVGTQFCINCGRGMFSQVKNKVQFYTAGFVLGILSLCIPFYGFILGIIGLPLACISKRKSAIIMNIIGICLFVLFLIFIFISANIATEYSTYTQQFIV